MKSYKNGVNTSEKLAIIVDIFKTKFHIRRKNGSSK